MARGAALQVGAPWNGKRLRHTTTKSMYKPWNDIPFKNAEKVGAPEIS